MSQICSAIGAEKRLMDQLLDMGGEAGLACHRATPGIQFSVALDFRG